MGFGPPVGWHVYFGRQMERLVVLGAALFFGGEPPKLVGCFSWVFLLHHPAKRGATCTDLASRLQVFEHGGCIWARTLEFLSGNLFPSDRTELKAKRPTTNPVRRPSWSAKKTGSQPVLLSPRTNFCVLGPGTSTWVKGDDKSESTLAFWCSYLPL